VKFLRPTHPYIKLHGQWRYLYRAIDRNGALVDVMFSEHRDMAASEAFFQSAKTVTDVTPDRVTTTAIPVPFGRPLGEGVNHRTNRYLNNRLEQDHRGIKGRYQPMRGFKCHDRRSGSVEATMNCVTSSVPAPALINMFPPTTVGSTFSVALRP